MAKDTKKAAETKAENQAVENTPENIVENIRNKNLLTEDAVKAAAEQIEKDAAEDKKREAMRAIKRFEYKNARALIELRRRRAEEKVSKEYLTKTKENFDSYMAGKSTLIEANKADETASEEKDKKFRELNKEFDGYIRELRQAYPGYWCYEWD